MPSRQGQPNGSPIPPIDGGDRHLQRQVERLHRVLVRLRWMAVAVLWLITLPISLWILRRDIRLLLDAFTWTGVRYALAFEMGVAIALSACIAFTLAILVWQSRNILFGMPRYEVKRLRRHVDRIRRKGPRHPLWRWVCQPDDER